MTNYIISDEAFLKIKAAMRLKKLLQKEGKLYQQAAHRRCGVGLTPSEFDAIVQGLVQSGWCIAKEGPNGGVLLVFVEVFADVQVPDAASLRTTNTPSRPLEEVVAHAMQCPPITEELLAGKIRK